MDIVRRNAENIRSRWSLSTQQYMRWLGAFGSTILLAFTWLPNSYSYMVGWPYALIWQGAFCLLGIHLIWQCRKFDIPFYRLGHGFDGIAILVMASMILSTIAAPFRAVACWNLLLVANYVAYLYILVNWLRVENITRHSLWRAISVIGIVTSVISLALWRPNLDMWLSQEFNDAIRNAQPLGHHNFVGGYALLLLPIVGCFALSLSRWRRWLTLGATLLVAIALYASGSRGALLGLFALCTTAASIGMVLSKGRSRYRWIIASAGLAIALVFVLASNPRVRTLFSVDPPVDQNKVSVISLSDGPAKDRLFMLDTARQILKKHPLLGVGPGNLSRVYNNYRPIEAGAGLTLVQQLHNTPAQLAAELGIMGISIYASVLFLIGRLCIRLRTQIEEKADRLLLCAIAASWFGYAVSSLTDYQIENVGISTTLIVTVALLIHLSDSALLRVSDTQETTTVFLLTNRTRRFMSLLALLTLCASFQLWTRTSASFYISYAALRDIQSFDFVAADRKWTKSAQLTPWDPTPSALAAEKIVALMKETDSEADIEELRLPAIEYMKSALKAAPNDPWFNQNLALLLLEQGSPEAEKYAEKAARLAPRNHGSYTDYTLGLTYLAQNKIEKAKAAFVLEAIANPVLMLTNVWKNPSTASLYDDVISKTLESYRQILSETNEGSIQHQWLSEQLLVLSWWNDGSITADQISATRPLVRAILLADDDSQSALDILNAHTKENASSFALNLLQARLSPSQHLATLLKEFDGTEEEKRNLRRSIESESDMKSWLNEGLIDARSQLRVATGFAYRNVYANTIRLILQPDNIQVGILPSVLGLFKTAPREYPQLDQYIADVRENKLSIN